MADTAQVSMDNRMDVDMPVQGDKAIARKETDSSISDSRPEIYPDIGAMHDPQETLHDQHAVSEIKDEVDRPAKAAEPLNALSVASRPPAGRAFQTINHTSSATLATGASHSTATTEHSGEAHPAQALTEDIADHDFLPDAPLEDHELVAKLEQQTSSIAETSEQNKDDYALGRQNIVYDDYLEYLIAEQEKAIETSNSVGKLADSVSTSQGAVDPEASVPTSEQPAHPVGQTQASVHNDPVTDLKEVSKEHDIVGSTQSETEEKTIMPLSAEEALDKGSLRRVYEGEQISEPCVQCVLIKPMPDNGTSGQRYRVVWSDSENYIQSMLTQQSSHLVTENKLQKGNICKLKQYQANVVKDKTILIVIDLEILAEYGEPAKIGNPAALDGPKQEGTESKPQTENINGNNFYGKQNGSAAPAQQARALPTRTSSSHGNITPIEAVSPYSHKWTIKARCTHKGPIKKWHKNTGEGQLFSCNFLDESGEIRATGFNAEVDKLYELITEGNVYYVSAPCRVNFAKRQFSNVNNDYELTFESGTIVEKADDMDGVPQVRYNFTTLEDLQNVEKDTTIDCIGILQEVGEVSEIVSKTTSKPYQKRELSIVDETGYSVRLTIWGQSAQSFEADPSSVVAFKGVKVSDFGGRSLSLLSSGSMTMNPDIEESHKLKGWYNAAGSSATFQTHNNVMSTVGATAGGKNQDYKTIGQVGEENLGMNPTGDADWFTIKATVLYIRKENVSYPACRTEGCNKKVISTSPDDWRCEKCDKSWPKPQWRYVLSINVADHTGQLWLSCFDDTGKLIMGMSADELQEIREEEGGDGNRSDTLFAAATCKSYIFRCKAKMDTFQDQQRVRYQVQSCSAPNYGAEANKLAALIKQYNINDGDSLFVN